MNAQDRENCQHTTACNLCSRNCGITITTEGRHFIKIKGDETHPMTQGYICQKAARLEHYQNHADRLTQPLKKEPDGSFSAIGWHQALTEISQKLIAQREQYGCDAFAFVGGGGQGNHLGGVYAQQLRYAMGGSRFIYPALAQEKTMDFWVNGRLFGNQSIHCTEDVEHADYVLFIGCNPFQSHGIPNARHTLKALQKNPKRTMVVIDPRKTETAKMADIHLQVKPGADAYLLSAMLAFIVQEALYDRSFLAKNCTGFDALKTQLLAISVKDYAKRADVPLALVKRVAKGFAQADSACVRVDLGLQHSLHSTLTSYLEKMLYMVTGNFGKRGGNNLHTAFLPLLGNTDERKRDWKRTAYHKMMPISGMYPPNILPDEIELAGENRIRSVWVDSCNPLLTYADSQAYARAFEKLDLLVVVDVAMTETARMANYILPAASQYEKWEATGFNMEFPKNFFHLRKPVLTPLENTLPEPEIYTRLLTYMGVIPNTFPGLTKLAKMAPEKARYQTMMGALATMLKLNKHLAPYAASILYKTLGPALPENSAAAAILLPLAMQYAKAHPQAVKRVGISGNAFTLGANLFKKILNSPEGTLISEHYFRDLWHFIKNPDKRIHLEIPEVLAELSQLQQQPPSTQEDSSNAEYPFILMAGERRSYNANQIYRNPAWRKTDKHGALRIHPTDAEALGISTGDMVLCESKNGTLEVISNVDDSVRPGMVTLPHGYGMQYAGGEPNGPALNQLTQGDHCDPFTKTPYHKHVPVKLVKIEASIPIEAPKTATNA